MNVTDIVLEDFRNYRTAHIQPGSGVNVFIGDNAQGKTNIFESVFLCCVGKSHRTGKDADMIRHGQRKASVCVKVQRRDGPRTVEVQLEPSERKRIKVMGGSIRRISELMGHINCIMFSPEDLYIVKGGPSMRRRFIDILLCQLRPVYYSTLTAYNSALAQRNAALREQNADSNVLDALEHTLRTNGAKVLEHRRQFLSALGQSAALVYSQISRDEQLTVNYKTQAAAEDTKQSLIALYAASRSDDIRRASTSIGPHRDDILLALDGKDAREFASQGQQRSIALALKIAGALQMEKETGEKPIIMLDDVFSELDEKRRTALLKLINGQALITSADNKTAFAGASVFNVKNGVVAPSGEL